MEKKNLVRQFKGQVKNLSFLDAEKKKKVCVYIGRAVPKMNEPESFVIPTTETEFNNWWEQIQDTKNNGNKSQKKDKKKTQIDKLPKDMAEKSGWLAIQDGVSLSGIDHQIFMAKVMQMFDDEMQSAEYRERMNKEMAKVNELQSKVNSLTAKIQPTLDEIAQLKNEIASIEKQWDKRTNFRSVVGQYTNILHSNSADSCSETNVTKE